MIHREETEPERTPKRIRKNPYVPHLAASRFRPTHDWPISEARRLYQTNSSDFLDVVDYEDCIEGMRRLEPESIDCIVADPPFGLSFTGMEGIYNRDYRYVKRGYREALGDYAEFSRKWISELPRIMKNVATAWIFSGWTNLFEILEALKDSELNLVNHIIWRYQFGVYTERKFVTSHYHLLFLSKSKSEYYFNKIQHYPLDVWEINRTYRKGEVKNATKLPGELVRRCLDFTTKPGDVVLDPFMGNGTTALIAKANFRHYVGFEVNESMKKIIEANVSSVRAGESYLPYSEREQEEIVKRAREKYGPPASR